VISATRPLVLGSASPRRSAILSSLRIPFVVLPADIDEDVQAGESPPAYLERIALAKLAAVWSRIAAAGEVHGAPDGVAAILVADTTVVIDDTIVGKPLDVADAVATLSRLVGRTHTVLTRYLIGRAAPLGGGADVLAARTTTTRVNLREAGAEEVLLYARTGEGLDKAGAYAAQGIGAFLVQGVEGSYSNVIGLPACELICDLRQSGLIAHYPMSVAEL
jgi:nucleoside triphosphate pyrophosphatase